MSNVAASTEHIRELHTRINLLSERFGEHDTRNAERFASLETRSKHIEKEQDKQGEKLEAIESVVIRMDGKLDSALKDRAKDSDTRFLAREKAKADIWMERGKKALIGLGIALAGFGGFKIATGAGDDSKPTKEPTDDPTRNSDRSDRR